MEDGTESVDRKLELPRRDQREANCYSIIVNVYLTTSRRSALQVISPYLHNMCCVFLQYKDPSRTVIGAMGYSSTP